MKINNFQAKLILKTKVRATTSEVWLRFDGKYSYPYINQGLNLLKRMGYIDKEKSSGRKREVYYQSTKDVIKIAEEVLNEPVKQSVEEAGTDTGQMPEVQEHHDGADPGDKTVRVLQQQLPDKDKEKD